MYPFPTGGVSTTRSYPQTALPLHTLPFRVGNLLEFRLNPLQRLPDLLPRGMLIEQL